MQLTINLFLSILKFVFVFSGECMACYDCHWAQNACLSLGLQNSQNSHPSILQKVNRKPHTSLCIFCTPLTNVIASLYLQIDLDAYKKTNYRQTYIQWASCYLLEGNNLADGYDFIMSKIFKAYAYTALTHLPLYLMGKHCRSI